MFGPLLKRGQENCNLGGLRKAKLLEAAEPGPTFTKLSLSHELTASAVRSNLATADSLAGLLEVGEHKLRASTNEKTDLTWRSIVKMLMGRVPLRLRKLSKFNAAKC